MEQLKSKEFWQATLVRVFRTICQTALTLIGCAVVWEEVNWLYVLSACGLAGLVSLLNAMVTGLPEVDMTKPTQIIINGNGGVKNDEK